MPIPSNVLLQQIFLTYSVLSLISANISKKFQISTLLVSIKFPFKRSKILPLFLHFPPLSSKQTDLHIIYLFLKAQKFIVTYSLVANRTVKRE